MPFLNRIRLPFYVSRPQFPDDANIFRKADGSRKITAVQISKVYEGETDKLPEWIHQRLVIALLHDTVNIESDRYLFGAVKDGSYDIDWQEFLDYPVAKATFKVAVSPFDASNANCQSCELAAQVILFDDVYTGELLPETEYQISVFDNDTINCSPITAEIVFTNPAYIAAASIDAATGVVTFTMGTLFYQRNGVQLISYRVTCENGAYDEASIYSNISAGDPVACLEPVNVAASAVTEDTATISWEEPATPPALGYEWKIAPSLSPTLNFDSGTETGLTLNLPFTSGTFLEPSTDYVFSIRSKCDVDSFSEWIQIEFTTSSLSEANECGRYTITHFSIASMFKNIQYIDCSSTVRTIRIKAFKPRSICALQTSAGHPVSIIGADEITYVSSC